MWLFRPLLRKMADDVVAVLMFITGCVVAGFILAMIWQWLALVLTTIGAVQVGRWVLEKRTRA